ncbi:hypothetical protein C1Y40_04787 [Mycobacterium talmoniae]|uniref:Uncharacterized protein n=1 Tax=Mycobacterium talmoniae TaxID=1858794 RepID=A0A2S8BEG7_9MYCO|nr:hypothetical protein C1Y40_04787 [Mycobacterium talmoniae]
MAPGLGGAGPDSGTDRVVTVIAPGGHPYDYYYRPGMPLRPPPPRLQPDPAWADLPVFDDFRPAAPTRRQHDLLELFIDHYWQGDALMDAVVERFRVIGVAHGRRLLDQALARGIDSLDDPPPELVDLFASLDNPPEWHDAKEWERGRRLWVDCSLAGKVGMVIQDAIGTFVGARCPRRPEPPNASSTPRWCATWRPPNGSTTPPSRVSSTATARSSGKRCGCGSCTPRCGRGCGAPGATSISAITATPSRPASPWAPR